MLFVANRCSRDIISHLRLLGGSNEKSILLMGDGAWYASEGMKGRLDELGLKNTYVLEDSLSEKGVPVSNDCIVVGFDEMVALIMERGFKVISL